MRRHHQSMHCPVIVAASLPYVAAAAVASVTISFGCWPGDPLPLNSPPAAPSLR